ERASNGPATQASGAGIIRQNGRILEGLAQRANELGRVLLEQGVASGDINPVLEKINELEGMKSEPAYSELHEQALAALMELEYRLRQQLDERGGSEILISEPVELPEDYRDMVADYYRGLSGE
ncbi:MAG: hypothetical protein HKN34_12450, partial [Gammaproteobacteria bacterium]|nr:hypothetical protein [Gammaproteobacteria bacterium]